MRQEIEAALAGIRAAQTEEVSLEEEEVPSVTEAEEAASSATPGPVDALVQDLESSPEEAKPPLPGISSR